MVGQKVVHLVENWVGHSVVSTVVTTADLKAEQRVVQMVDK
jgi:hypothetical protein